MDTPSSSPDGERPASSDTSATSPVGYIGLGSMGAPMARRLLSYPGGLYVCDVRSEATEPFTGEGAPAGSVADLARECSVVSVTVLNDAQVRDVVAGPDGLVANATGAERRGDAGRLVIAVHSTISDSTAEELAAYCAENGVGFVD
ncbi:NAD(P)-binding domain-containing protein, partial [Dietzia sp.]|uniref:NAD(P)-binding domain-containing protein n=1 Tax=Dietzia sp. TaxID=1871616 RepID=UPI003FA54B9B